MFGEKPHQHTTADGAGADQEVVDAVETIDQEVVGGAGTVDQEVVDGAGKTFLKKKESCILHLSFLLSCF